MLHNAMLISVTSHLCLERLIINLLVEIVIRMETLPYNFLTLLVITGNVYMSG